MLAWFAVSVGFPVASAADPAPLRVAMSGRYPPLHVVDGADVEGFEVDLAGALAADLGRPLEIVDARASHVSVIDAVRTGKADIAMNAITDTAERRQVVDFTPPYLVLRYRLAGIRAPETCDDPCPIGVTTDLAEAAVRAG